MQNKNMRNISNELKQNIKTFLDFDFEKWYEIQNKN